MANCFGTLGGFVVVGILKDGEFIFYAFCKKQGLLPLNCCN